MLHISCPSCGERGKIPANMAGVRIKCKKCGAAFQVAAPERAPAAIGVGVGVGAAASTSTTTQSFDGIAVDGLDPGAWTLAPDQSSLIPTATVHHEPAPTPAAAEPAPPPPGEAKTYKLLTSRDKIFEGKFELARLEDALNHYARQGWTAKSMCVPHIKNFQGAMQEELVVLLER